LGWGGTEEEQGERKGLVRTSRRKKKGKGEAPKTQKVLDVAGGQGKRSQEAKGEVKGDGSLHTLLKYEGMDGILGLRRSYEALNRKGRDAKGETS